MHPCPALAASADRGAPIQVNATNPQPIHMDVTIAGVVLDMDGLMLDTEPIWRDAWQRAARELGFDLTDTMYVDFIGLPGPACEDLLVRFFGDLFPMEAFRLRRRAHWDAIVEAAGIPHKAGLLEFLDAVDDLGLPKAVATSTVTEIAALNLERAGLRARFPVIVGGEQVTRGKPSPDIYLEAARRLQVPPAACLALEDSNVGIVAARRAGMVSLLIPDLLEPSPEAHAAAHAELASLLDARTWLGSVMTRG
jgi:HAD superfamily hydrolase (TIGR01509 family)